MPLFFCILSIFLLLLGLIGFFPKFFGGIGIIVVLLLAGTAMLLGLRKQKKQTQVVIASLFVILVCLGIIAGSFYKKIEVQQSMKQSMDKNMAARQRALEESQKSDK